MKSYITSLLIMSSWIFSYGQTNEKQVFLIEKLNFYQPTQHLKIVAFMPTLTSNCDYASMMTTALNYYFVKNLAFSNPDSKPSIDVILVVKDQDERNTIDNNQITIALVTEEDRLNNNKLDGITVQYDPDGKYFNDLNVQLIDNPAKAVDEINNYDKSSTLFLLNEKNEIILKDDNYRAQGEHLKPLEHTIKNYLNLDNYNKPAVENAHYKVGDKADNFKINDTQNLLYDTIIEPKILTLRGDDESTKYLKVVTFYPAAFSGQFLPDFRIIDRQAMMSCVGQIRSLDSFNSINKYYNTYVISASTPKLLSLWHTALRTRHTIYVNDPYYETAIRYGAYNEKEGYNNRVTYIIDKEGVIRYIDTDYTYDDEKTIENEIEKLLKEDGIDIPDNLIKKVK